MAAPTSTPTATADARRGLLLLLAAFLLPLLLYLGTMSGAVQFDDGAQFVLCALDGSAAHPPGFPLWTTSAQIWVTLFGFVPPVVAVNAFVATLAASAIALLYLTFAAVLARPFAATAAPSERRWAAFTAALACATGATVWQWSHTAEVYSLQLFATALLLFGLCRGDGSARTGTLLAGLGIGIGLANHHVSTLLMLPLLPWLLVTTRGIGWHKALRSLLPAIGGGALIAGLAYLLLMLRAGDADDWFAFGEPGTPSRLWHHLSGGFFGDSMWREGVDYGGRASVLTMVVVRHFWLFGVALVVGVVAAWRDGRGLLLFTLGYAALLFGLQFGRMHTPNMDAGLLPALGVGGLLMALGCARIGGRRLLLLATLGFAAQFALNAEACNRRGYGAGDAVLADLDASAPANAIVLLSSWELQTISLLARKTDDWRPDLVVLSSNLKGTHRDLLARHHPEFHAAVVGQYEAFLAAVAAVDPDYVYTDYATLSTPALQQSYANLLQRVLDVARRDGRALLCDRQTVKFLLELKLVSQAQIAPCGMLFALGGATGPRPFPLAPGWLDHPFLMHDLCAIGVLHDYRTTSRQMLGYYQHHGNRELAAAAAAASRTLDATWNDYIAGKPAPRR